MRGVRRGFLKYYILKLLREDSYTGYGLIKKIEEETGFWEPSTGSVYPLLESLEDEDLIVGRETERGSSWQITEKGKKAYEEACEAKEKMKESIKQSMLVFSQIFREEEESIKEAADFIDKQFDNPSRLHEKIRGLHHRLNDLLNNADGNEEELIDLVERVHKKIDALEKREEQKDEQGN